MPNVRFRLKALSSRPCLKANLHGSVWSNNAVDSTKSRVVEDSFLLPRFSQPSSNVFISSRGSRILRDFNYVSVYLGRPSEKIRPGRKDWCIQHTRCPKRELIIVKSLAGDSEAGRSCALWVCLQLGSSRETEICPSEIAELRLRNAEGTRSFTGAPELNRRIEEAFHQRQ